MGRKIVIQHCTVCPHRDHKGGFGNPAYVPYCKLAKRELPYVVYPNARGNGTIANQVGDIPDWCPLEKN